MDDDIEDVERVLKYVVTGDDVGQGPPWSVHKLSEDYLNEEFVSSHKSLSGAHKAANGLNAKAAIALMRDRYRMQGAEAVAVALEQLGYLGGAKHLRTITTAYISKLLEDE